MTFSRICLVQGHLSAWCQSYYSSVCIKKHRISLEHSHGDKVHSAGQIEKSDEYSGWVWPAWQPPSADTVELDAGVLFKNVLNILSPFHFAHRGTAQKCKWTRWIFSVIPLFQRALCVILFFQWQRQRLHLVEPDTYQKLWTLEPL